MTNITKIRRLFDKGLTVREIIAKGYSTSQVYAESKRREAGEPVKPRGRPKANPIEKATITLKGVKGFGDALVKNEGQSMAFDYETFSSRPMPDPINPDYYKIGGIETADFIEAKKLNYNLGTVVWYISRADYKGRRIEDLKKAQWYLEREIAKGVELTSVSHPQKDDWA